MGCATSKEKSCRNCKTPYSPVRRSYTMHAHHPPQKTGDSYHLVSLTSSTLGSLNLDLLIENHVSNDTDKIHALIRNKEIEKKKPSKEEFQLGMIEAKTWSNMINDKIPKPVPKTPVRTPPGEPETINAWEMMEGLEDISPLRPVHRFRSFSFRIPRNSILSSIDDQQTTPKPLWADSDSNSNSNDTSIISEFDPDVIETFRRSLEDLPMTNPFHLKPLDKENGVRGDDIVPRGADKLVVYFTSLRGVRKTYEDCRHVRVILKGLGVKVDERDVSMHSGFKEELKEMLGEGSGGIGLPRVFLGRKCIGGAEEICRLNEEGKLEKMMEGCELNDDGDGGGGIGKVCESCGDIRFVPCETCSGSCKIYYERDGDGDGDYDDDEFDGCEDEYGFQRCPDCNENGLIRCPVCCE